MEQGAPVWGMQSNNPAQQQAPTSYGGGSSGQSWGQANQSAQPADPWNMPAAQQGWGQPQASSNPATGGNPGIPAWQQGSGQGPGYGGPPAPGNITGGQAPGGFGSPGLFGSTDNDKTMLRPSGSQGTLGIVRVEEGKEPGRVYEVRKEELSIGRSRESDIFLEDLAVSRLHAKIVSLGNGNYALKDEGSANGTKVNGQLVNKYQTYPLQEGDKIQLGQTVLVFSRR
jgi:FHA domain